jgi:hypothetical protein
MTLYEYQMPYATASDSAITPRAAVLRRSLIAEV